MEASSGGAQPSAYRNQPLHLGEIRLLTIETTNEPCLRHVFPWIPLELRLVTTRRKLKDKPDFDAVSYVWGTAPASISIPCNDGSILITPTAHHMLGFLRLQDRPFWIDAICINQDDDDEKAEQISLMRQIYAKASYVVVWMGALNSSIQSFMLDFPRVSLLAKSWTPKHPFGADDTHWRGTDWPDEVAQFWEGAYHLLYHEWFRRLWTFQEILLAQNSVLLVETLWIHAEDFFKFVYEGVYEPGGYMLFNAVMASRIVDNSVSSDFAYNACRTISQYGETFRKSASIVLTVNVAGVMQDLQFRSVKEGVDRVWAIVGLLEQSLQEQLKPLVDYSETGRTRYWKTYIQFSKAVFVTGQSLSLLTLPPTLERPDLVLPTWCSDFSKSATCKTLLDGYWNAPVCNMGSMEQLILIEGIGDGERSRARRDTILNSLKKSISIIQDDSRLQISGFIVDTISEVIKEPQLAGQLDYTRNNNWEHWTVDNPVHTAHMDVHVRALSLARRLFQESDSDRSGLMHYFMCCICDCRVAGDLETAYKDAMTVLTSGGHQYYNSLDPARRERGFAFLMQIVISTGHSFFASKSGRFGIAHPGCKPGDKVCAFYGGEPLYILRWPEIQGISRAEHADEPAVYCGAAFIPYLMEQHERDEARLGDDEMFHIR
jgi:hypothetical protein